MVAITKFVMGYDPLQVSIEERWTLIRSTFERLDEIKISRWLETCSQQTELHGFSDAWRTLNQQYTTTIVAAKTKVASTSQLSLPRLELCGALLLANLMRKIKKALNLDEANIWAWTDSTIVLSWLAESPKKWKCFVANRTAKILHIIPSSKWKHVPTQDNPADCTNRVFPQVELIHHPLWWSGLSWLRQEQEKWPKHPVIEPLP